MPGLPCRAFPPHMLFYRCATLLPAFPLPRQRMKREAGAGNFKRRLASIGKKGAGRPQHGLRHELRYGLQHRRKSVPQRRGAFSRFSILFIYQAKESAMTETPAPPEVPANPHPQPEINPAPQREPEIAPLQPDTETPDSPRGPEVVPDTGAPEIEPLE